MPIIDIHDEVTDGLQLIRDRAKILENKGLLDEASALRKRGAEAMLIAQRAGAKTFGNITATPLDVTLDFTLPDDDRRQVRVGDVANYDEIDEFKAKGVPAPFPLYATGQSELPYTITAIESGIAFTDALDQGLLTPEAVTLAVAQTGLLIARSHRAGPIGESIGLPTDLMFRVDEMLGYPRGDSTFAEVFQRSRRHNWQAAFSFGNITGHNVMLANTHGEKLPGHIDHLRGARGRYENIYADLAAAVDLYATALGRENAQTWIDGINVALSNYQPPHGLATQSRFLADWIAFEMLYDAAAKSQIDGRTPSTQHAAELAKDISDRGQKLPGVQVGKSALSVMPLPGRDRV